MKILWLDDDALESFNIGPLSIQTAKTCKEAAEYLSQDALPDWIIIDILVPQGGWGEALTEFPGLEFIKFVSSQYREKIRIAAYSIIMSDGMVEKLKAAGAAKCYAKSSKSFMSVIEDLRKSDTERGVKSAPNPGNESRVPYVVSFQDELKQIIGKLIDKLSLSTRAITEQEIADLHRAKLAIENDEEKRMRSYQTLKGLKGDVGTEELNTIQTQQDDSEQLRKTVELIIEHKRARRIFDVFLSYNSADAKEAEAIALALKTNAILPWFDQWEMKAGDRWQEELAKQIENIGCAVVLIGGSGVGPWHGREIEAFLIELTKRECPVIPVLLSSAGSTPTLPVFLRGTTWVDFRKGDQDNLQRLIEAIIG